MGSRSPTGFLSTGSACWAPSHTKCVRFSLQHDQLLLNRVSYNQEEAKWHKKFNPPWGQYLWGEILAIGLWGPISKGPTISFVMVVTDKQTMDTPVVDLLEVLEKRYGKICGISCDGHICGSCGYGNQ